MGSGLADVIDDLPIQKLRAYLAGDERLIWTGQPVRNLNFRPRDVGWLAFGFSWLSFASFIEYLLLTSAVAGLAHVFGALLVITGLLLVAGRFTIDGFIRAKTYYGISSKRILILQEFPGTEVRTIQLAAVSDLRLVQRSDGTGTIEFDFLPLSFDIRGFGWHRIAEGQHEYWAFASISDVRTVFDLIVARLLWDGDRSRTATRTRVEPDQGLESETDAALKLRNELVRDERLLWAGRPPRGLMIRGSDLFLVPIGLLWTAFAVLFEVAFTIPELPLSVVIFGLIYGAPFIAIGLYLLIGRPFVDSFERAGTYYALTTHRALILRTFPVRELRSFDLHRVPSISLSRRPDGSGTIAFHSLPYAPRNRGYTWRGFLQPVDSAFELIPSAEAVSALIPDVQSKMR